MSVFIIRSEDCGVWLYVVSAKQIFRTDSAIEYGAIQDAKRFDSKERAAQFVKKHGIPNSSIVSVSDAKRAASEYEL